jgi:serine phosphatase RsbU (regulator of sigma subunit)
MKIKQGIILSFFSLIISIVVIFFIGSTKLLERIQSDIYRSIESVMLISAENVNQSFDLVGKSTQAFGDNYLKNFKASKDISNQERKEALKNIQSTSKTTAFLSNNHDNLQFKSPQSAFFLWNDFDYNSTVIKELKVLKRMNDLMENMYKSFDYSWVYLTTINDLMAIYPYIPPTEMDGVYKPTNQHFYLAADFKNKKLGWEEPYLDLAGDGMMITVSYPIYDGDTLLGVASRDITVDQLSKSILEKTKIYEGTISFLIDKNGKAISNLNEEYLNEIKEVNKKKYKAVLYYRTKDGITKIPNLEHQISEYELLNKTSEEVLNRFPKQKSSYYFMFKANENYVVFASTIKITGWYLVSIIPLPSITKFTQESLTKIAVITFSSIFLIFFIVWIGIRNFFLNPLSDLSSDALKISAGNYDAKFSVNTKNEVGELANVLREMSINISQSKKQLEDYNQNLEHKIQERTESLNTQKVELEKKNNTIMHSLQYANKMQFAILPSSDLINKAVNTSVFLWKPKDLVGGDIYFIREVIPSKKYILSVLDCTGHGVPGALMSMAVHSVLNSIIENKKITAPSQILSELHNTILNTINNNIKGYSLGDGLDIGICFIEKDLGKISFSGANIPLFIWNSGIITEIKANKTGVGYRSVPSDYTFQDEIIKISNEDVFFLFSDGIKSQMGGENSFPLGQKKFLEFLSNLNWKSIEENGHKIEKFIDDYRGSEEQIDDITFVGFTLENTKKRKKNSK